MDKALAWTFALSVKAYFTLSWVLEQMSVTTSWTRMRRTLMQNYSDTYAGSGACGCHTSGALTAMQFYKAVCVSARAGSTQPSNNVAHGKELRTEKRASI